jgi:hypothetical protein
MEFFLHLFSWVCLSYYGLLSLWLYNQGLKYLPLTLITIYKNNNDLHWSIIMKFKSWLCSDSKLYNNWENEHVNIHVPLSIT